MQEETGLTIKQPELRAVVTVYDAAWPIHWLLLVFRAYDYTGELCPCDEGELRWIKRPDLAQYPRPHADQQYWAHIIGNDASVWRGKYVYDTPHTLISETHY